MSASALPYAVNERRLCGGGNTLKLQVVPMKVKSKWPKKHRPETEIQFCILRDALALSVLRTLSDNGKMGC